MYNNQGKVIQRRLPLISSTLLKRKTAIARISPILCIVTVIMFAGGCGANLFPPQPGPTFTMPLVIDGVQVDEAIVDTGGEYELMLRDSYGLEIVGQVQVVAFEGRESVDVTEEFDFTIGGVRSTTEAALVGISVCDCSGVGFPFFRKAKTVLALDFETLDAHFASRVSADGIELPFVEAPESLTEFDSAFLEVTVENENGEIVPVTGLLDSGTNGTILRRTLLPPSQQSADQVNILIEHPLLGTVSVSARLFDTPGLPDLILGTDIMGAWGQKWYFDFHDRGGTTTVLPWPVTASLTDPE